MNITHTKYIKRMSDQTGKTYRDLESEWNQAQKEFEFDQMMEPNRYSHLSSKKGTTAQEINKRFEEKVLKPVEQTKEEIEEKVSAVGEEEFTEEIEQEMETGKEMLEEVPEEGFEDIKSEITEPETKVAEEEGFEDIKSEIENEEEPTEESENLESRTPTERPV